MIINKRWVNIVMAAVICAAVTLTSVAFFISAKSNRMLPIYSVNNNRKQVAITFDAAWTDSNVDELIKIMKQYNVKSTVFAVGEWADKYPEAVKKLSKAGHEIGNHSNAHKHLDSLNDQQFISDTKLCNQKIEKLTGKKVSLYRGPYGEYNNNTVKAIESLGMYYIQWDCDSLDWKPNYTVEMIASSAVKNVKSGSIILLHIGAKHTSEALPMILSKLQSEGYEFVTVSRLIYKKNYTIDNTGMQKYNQEGSINGK